MKLKLGYLAFENYLKKYCFVSFISDKIEKIIQSSHFMKQKHWFEPRALNQKCWCTPSVMCVHSLSYWQIIGGSNGNKIGRIVSDAIVRGWQWSTGTWRQFLFYHNWVKRQIPIDWHSKASRLQLNLGSSHQTWTHFKISRTCFLFIYCFYCCRIVFQHYSTI